ncbi:hypothetical protein [Kribbella sp. C-35]|uniref:hypothetical protein n=1 Tax=Kribbella sp. C-35 TaxID=2789276 RepID=UPI0039788B70
MLCCANGCTLSRRAGTPYCLEINALPGLTPGSLVPVAAKGAGITYGELVDRLLTASGGGSPTPC